MNSEYLHFIEVSGYITPHFAGIMSTMRWVEPRFAYVMSREMPVSVIGF